jgi:hypothetical protein
MTTRLSKRLKLDYSKVLTAIFELMLNAGVASETLESECSSALRRAEERARLGRVQETGDFVTAGLVLDAWHRDRRYLNKHATPKAVRLLGPAPSVEALARAQRSRKNAAQIARRLRTLHLVIPSGRDRYVPTSDVAVVSAQDPLTVQYTARTLSTLLETVGRNVSNARRLAPLIERVAEVPDLPQEEIEAFEAFTQIQGKNFLRTINDWLESRRAIRAHRRRSKSTVRAGVHTYAYVAPLPHSTSKTSGH